MSIPPEQSPSGVFAIVDNRIARARKNLSDGAVVTFAYLSSRTGLQGGEGGEFATIPKGGLGLALGTTQRSAERYIAELKKAKYIVAERSASRSWHYRIAPELERKKTINRSSFAVVEVDVFANPAWTMGMKRAWIALWSYADRNGMTFVAMGKLATAIGKKRRQTIKLISAIEMTKRLNVTRRKRASSVYKMARSDRHRMRT